MSEGTALQVQREATSSIEVTRSVKGEYGWHIKRYYDETVSNGIGALSEITAIDAALRQHFLKAEESLDKLPY